MIQIMVAGLGRKRFNFFEVCSNKKCGEVNVVPDAKHCGFCGTKLPKNLVHYRDIPERKPTSEKPGGYSAFCVLTKEEFVDGVNRMIDGKPLTEKQAKVCAVPAMLQRAGTFIGKTAKRKALLKQHGFARWSENEAT